MASARFENAVGVDVTHELLRNVLLNANTGYTRADFEGTAGPTTPSRPAPGSPT